MIIRSSIVQAATFALAIACGCASDGFKNIPESSTGDKSQASRGKDDSDPWNDVGREAKGDRPIQKENDPLRDLFVSPKAQEIERSLGVQ